MHRFTAKRVSLRRSTYGENQGTSKGKFYGTFLTAYELAHLHEDSASKYIQNHKEAAERVRPGRKLRDAHWHGGLGSVKQVTDMIDKGWPEGVAKIEALREKIGDPLPNDMKPQNMRRRRCWSDEGDDVSYDRLMGGEIDVMWRTTERRQSGIMPTVSIAFSWGALGGVTADAMLWGGATALAISDLFEDCGYSVEIVAVNTSSHGGSTYTATCVQVKNTDEPMRIDTLATICCHAGVFRTLGFAAKMLSDVRCGVGGTEDAATFDLSEFPLEGNCYSLPLIYSEREALRQIERACKHLGGVEESV